uniref:DUF834 domain-containing protein n=1 Tax=Oryza meridionalis TaxID=40149 RepID=A0A0E0EHS2_9ORYZ
MVVSIVAMVTSRVLLAQWQADAVVAWDGGGGGGGRAKARNASEVENEMSRSRSDILDFVSCGDMGSNDDEDTKHRNPRKRQPAFNLTRR